MYTLFVISVSLLLAPVYLLFFTELPLIAKPKPALSPLP
jgi:hypothetical protein